MCYYRGEMLHTIHRAVVVLKLGTMAFMMGSVITLGVLARAQSSKPIGERVAVAENQIETAKGEIVTMRTQIATLADQVSTMRGMGIGAVALLTMLDTVQLVLLKRKTS